MSQPTEPMNVDRDAYHTIIPHAAEPWVLLLPGEDGWRLPDWAWSEGRSWSRVGLANQAMAEQLGIHVTTRRCVKASFDTAAGATRNVYVYWMENRSPGWAPPDGARWATHADLASLAMAIPEQRELLDAWFADARGGHPPPLRAPWAHSGWFDTAAAWIAAQMERQGIIATGPVEQHRSLTISCLLRVNTTSGDLFMKASPPEMFAVEATLTHALAERYPGHVPTLLATDPGRNWMLMRDFGGGLLGKCPQIARWEEVIRARGITDCPDAGARLRDLYLEAWTEFEPMERLRQAFDLSQLLARLHQAQSYHWISAHLEESALWEWRWGASSWLRGLLKRIDEPR